MFSRKLWNPEKEITRRSNETTNKLLPLISVWRIACSRRVSKFGGACMEGVYASLQERVWRSVYARRTFEFHVCNLRNKLIEGVIKDLR